MVKRLIAIMIGLSLFVILQVHAQENTTTVTGHVTERGMYIDMQGMPNPTLTVDNSPIAFKFTTEQALEYGLVKDGTLVDTSNWKVKIVYEKLEIDNRPVYAIKSFKKLD